MKKQFLILFAFISVLALSQVPQRFNKVIVTGDIVSPKYIVTNSNNDSVLLGAGGRKSVESFKTDTVSLSNRINAKATGSGTASGTNTGDETTATIKTKLGAASSSNSGYLVNTDWAKFNTSYTSRIQSVESPLYFTAGTIGSGYASSNSNGLLSSTDWGTFNGKQNALGSNQTTALSNLTGINFNTVPKSTAGGYANSLITDDGTTVSVSGNLTATNLTATNTGDETLTSIKTKLGAATSVSDGYLKYQDWNTFNAKEPAFSKNSGFNLPLGSTPGTVLEGRTFGTAANSAVGDFIQNQNSSAQSANMWIDKDILLGNGGAGFGTAGLILNYSNNTSTSRKWKFINDVSAYGDLAIQQSTAQANNTYSNILRFDPSGAATFSSTVNSTGFLLNGNNLTSSLTTNNIPKWNGSSFVNSLISDNGTGILIGNNSSSATTTPITISLGGTFPTIPASYSSVKFKLWDNGAQCYGLGISPAQFEFVTALDAHYSWFIGSDKKMQLENSGDLSVYSTTPSTSPTTGALVVTGGIGADHVGANQFYGSGSNLTGVQLPITLTTNGTSGAATFSGNVLNVPNYTSSGGVDQTQTTVNGSTSGNIVGSMPFQTGSYKKVIISVNSLNGSATYTFPSSFSMLPRGSSSLSITALSTTSITIAGTGSTGWCTIEGY